MELYGVLDPDEVDSVVIPAAAVAFTASVLLIVSQIFFGECYGVLVRAIYRTGKNRGNTKFSNFENNM